MTDFHVYTTEKLADRITAIETIPSSAIEASHRCILDAVSAAVAGHSTRGAIAGRTGAVAAWGAGAIPIWLTGTCSNMIGAAFANSVATSILDIDDGHRAAAGHPGAAIIPAVLATVHENEALQHRAATAIAIGYEVGIRIAASRDLRTLDTVNSGRWCGQAVAAAVGWLKGLPAETIAAAISTAGMVAPQMPSAEFTQVGNHVKEAIPHATLNGLMSLCLAQAGFDGPLDILDDDRHFRADAVLSGFGESWLIETTYFKSYSCCRWIHAPIDGLIKIMSEKQLSFEDITKIRVETFGKGVYTLNNQKAPKTLEAAQFSTPFRLGVTASRGTKALLPMTDPALLNDKATLLIASRTEMVLDKELDSYFSAAVPARISVLCGDTVFTETVMAPLGEATNPMDWGMLIKKFQILAEPQLRAKQMTRLQQALEDMRSGDLTPLLLELSQPIDNGE